MELLKKSVEIIFSPVGITTILIGAGIILSFSKRYARGSRRFLFCGGLLFLVLLLTPLSEYLVLGLEKDYPPMLKPAASAEIERIVVLAGYAEENKLFPVTTVVSERTIGSISEGLRLYRQLPGAKLIMSGGVVREGEKPLAASMADFLQEMGVPASDIIVEGNSRNTYENLFEVKKLIGTNPFILVAQACDLRRAMAVARKLNMNPTPAPACYRVLPHYMNNSTSDGIAPYFKAFLYPSTGNLARIQWAYHEYVGYAWYKLLGRI